MGFELVQEFNRALSGEIGDEYSYSQLPFFQSSRVGIFLMETFWMLWWVNILCWVGIAFFANEPFN